MVCEHCLHACPYPRVFLKLSEFPSVYEYLHHVIRIYIESPRTACGLHPLIGVYEEYHAPGLSVQSNHERIERSVPLLETAHRVKYPHESRIRAEMIELGLVFLGCSVASFLFRNAVIERQHLIAYAFVFDLVYDGALGVRLVPCARLVFMHYCRAVQKKARDKHRQSYAECQQQGDEECLLVQRTAYSLFFFFVFLTHFFSLPVSLL